MSQVDDDELWSALPYALPILAVVALFVFPPARDWAVEHHILVTENLVWELPTLHAGLDWNRMAILAAAALVLLALAWWRRRQRSEQAAAQR